MAGAEHVDRRAPGGPVFHDESLMPVTMGTPYRVPDYAYGAWGLTYQGEHEADKAYAREWGAGNSGQLGFVEQATIEAGMGNFPALLRDTAATAIAALVDRRAREIQIMDIGAGPGTSADAVYEALGPEVSSRVDMFLVDPSTRSLFAAKERLEGKGRNNFDIHTSDSDIVPAMDSNTYDVVMGVASVHHHARIPFDEYKRVLKPGGFLVLADWHQPIWEHPGSVRWFLEQMDWPKKDEGLANWDKVYPQAVGYGDPRERFSDPADVKAIDQITAFWSAYQRIQNEQAPGANAIWPLEGHRPVGRYVQEMQRAGLHLGTPRIEHLLGRGIRSNPHQILPDSSLLQLTIAQKI